MPARNNAKQRNISPVAGERKETVVFIPGKFSLNQEKQRSGYDADRCHQ